LGGTVTLPISTIAPVSSRSPTATERCALTRITSQVALWLNLNFKLVVLRPAANGAASALST
jgi:hypothetical protein